MCTYVLYVFAAVLFPGVEDEMALALELSRRGTQTSGRPQVQNRLPTETGRLSSPYSAANHRSFSSEPFFNYGGVETSSDDDKDDEDLQMAMACSLSEMEAQQAAAATDFISGAGGRGRGVNDKAGVHKETRVFKTTLNVSVSGKEKDDEGQFKISSGPRGRWEMEGNETMKQGFSPESPTTSSSTPLSREQEPESVVKPNDGSAKKKKRKCRCTVC